MDRDFHYYGTYCAARIAGYDNNEAKDIAFYAQFVDECTKTFIGGLKCINPDEAVITVQSGTGIAKKYGTLLRDCTKEDIRQIAAVWCPFHFLPVNEDKYSFREMTEEEKSQGFAPAAMKLICLPEGRLFEKTKRGLTSKAHPSLAHIGMAMHVLADTWAHKYFAGIPSWWLNEAGKTLSGLDKELDEDSEKNREIKFGPFHSHWSTTAGRGYYSACYMGHGRMGHLPDMGYLQYNYKPNWSDMTIYKDNKKDFADAFAYMALTMKRICKGRNSVLSDREQSAINDAVKELTEKKISIHFWSSMDAYIGMVCENMAAYINQRHKKEGDILPDENEYKRRLENLKHMTAADRDAQLLREFFAAAAEHRNMVVRECGINTMNYGGSNA